MALPSPEDDYTKFDNVGSGESGTVEGLIDMDGPASAFRYRKEIAVTAAANSGVIVKGRWKVRIRDSAVTDENGGYTGLILFEQEVEWGAMITNIDFGGISLVTWQPLVSKAYTTICNGEECAVIDATESAASKAAYDASGAWRFLDRTTLPTTLQAKMDLEYKVQGATDFEPEGVAVIGDYQFFATWQSENYVCGFPEGAVFETVFDRWQFGSLDDEALFQVSYKPGVPLTTALRDPRVGTVWWFYSFHSAIYCAQTRNDQGFLQRADDPVVYDGVATYFRAFRHGATLYAWVQDSGTVLLLESRDEGVGWMGTFALQESIKVLATQLSDDGGAFYIYAQATATVVSNDPDNPLVGINQGDMVRIIVRLKGTFWELAEIGTIKGDDLPDKNIIALECHKRTLYLMSNTDQLLAIFRSTDELKSLEALPSGE